MVFSWKLLNHQGNPTNGHSRPQWSTNTCTSLRWGSFRYLPFSLFGWAVKVLNVFLYLSVLYKITSLRWIIKVLSQQTTFCHLLPKAMSTEIATLPWRLILGYSSFQGEKSLLHVFMDTYSRPWSYSVVLRLREAHISLFHLKSQAWSSHRVSNQ